MAARKIETTIALDGEQAFKSALSSATREMRVMESEMKALSAAYDANGNSAQFFAAKQSNLRNQIAQQREIIQSLERAVEDAGKAYGENSAQVDAYAIRLNNARTRLSRLEQQLSETDSEMEELGRDAQRAGRQLEDGIGEGAEAAQSKLESLVSAMKEDLGSIQTNTAITAVKTVWDMATGAYSSIEGFVEGTADYRKQLSFLKQNAELHGFDFDKIEKQLIEVTGLTGDSSAAIEGLSNLLAAGVDERQLEEAIDSLAGAVISFPDTLKFESLADGLQETIATGAATGAFGELLGRLGVDLEEFNGALAASDSAAGDLDIALSYLAAHGLKQVYEQWLKTNGAMSDAAKTQAALEIELAKFATTLEKHITTPIKKKEVEVLEYVNGEIEKWETDKALEAGMKDYFQQKVKKGEMSESEAQASEKALKQYQTGKKLLDPQNPLNMLLGLGESMWTGLIEGAEWVGKAFTNQQEQLDNAETYIQQQVMDGLNGAELPEVSLVEEAGAEAKDAGTEAGKQYGKHFNKAVDDYMHNEHVQIQNPLKNVSPGQQLIDRMGVGEQWKEQLDAITKGTAQVVPEAEKAGAEMGAAMSEGMQQSTQDLSALFPKQVVVEAENAIPAMGIAGGEAGKEYGQTFVDAYKGIADTEFPQLPNPLDELDPSQAIANTMEAAEEWTTMLDTVTEAAGEASSAMAEEGVAMGVNYADGISSTEGDVVDAAERLTEAAEEGVSGASGAGAFYAGSNIGEQLAAGLLSQVSYVASASSRLGDAATSGIRSGGVRAPGASGSTSSVINTVLNIDGRTFASATSSYMSAALATRYL